MQPQYVHACEEREKKKKMLISPAISVGVWDADAHDATCMLILPLVTRPSVAHLLLLGGGQAVGVNIPTCALPHPYNIIW